MRPSGHQRLRRKVRPTHLPKEKAPSAPTARSERLGSPPTDGGPAPRGLRRNVRKTRNKDSPQSLPGAPVTPGYKSSEQSTEAPTRDALVGRGQLTLAGPPQKCREVAGRLTNAGSTAIRETRRRLLSLTGSHFSRIRFPPNGFAVFLTLFSKYFSPFPHGTCSLSVSCQYLALDGVYHPLWAAIPNNPTLRRQ